MGKQLASHVGAGKALTPLTGHEFAHMRAKRALNLPAEGVFIEGCRVHDLKLQRKIGEFQRQTIAAKRGYKKCIKRRKR